MNALKRHSPASGWLLILLFSFALAPHHAFSQQNEGTKLSDLRQQRPPLPKTLLALYTLKGELMDTYRQYDDTSTQAESLNTLEHIVEIEKRAITILKSRSPEALSDFEGQDFDEMLQQVRSATLANGKLLASEFEASPHFMEETARTIQHLIEVSTDVNGRQHWETQDLHRQKKMIDWRINASAQDLKTFEEVVTRRTRARALVSEGKHSESLAESAEALRGLEALGLEKTTIYNTIQYHRAEALLLAGQPDQATATLQKLMKAEEELPGTSNPFYYQTIWLAASIFHKAGRSGDAVKLLEDAGKKLQKQFPEGSVLEARNLVESGDLFQELNRLKDAVESYDRAWTLLKKNGETQTVLGMGALNGMQDVYEAVNDYASAEIYADRKSEIGASLYGRKSIDMANLLLNQGAIKRALGKHEEAEELFVLSRSKYEALGGVDAHIDFLLLLDNIGLNYRSMGKPDKGLETAEQAYDLTKNLPSPNPLGLANRSTNKGLMHYDIGNIEKARSLFRDAAELRKEAVGEDHPSYAEALNNVGWASLALDEFDDAIALFTQSSELSKKAFGQQNSTYQGTMLALASAHEKQGDKARGAAIREQVAKLQAGPKEAGEAQVASESESAPPQEEAASDSAKESEEFKPLSQDDRKAISETIQTIIEKGKSNDAAGIFERILPPEDFKKMQAMPNFEELKANFAARKMQRLVNAMKTLDVSTAKRRGSTIVFRDVQPPMYFSKIGDSWYLKN